MDFNSVFYADAIEMKKNIFSLTYKYFDVSSFDKILVRILNDKIK